MGAAELVGRDFEVDAIRDALRAAEAGHGAVVLIGGEPGIGKTRLAQHAASIAEQEGFAVAWGNCWEGGGAPVYWPWRQLLRPHVSTLAADRALGARLAPILPLVGVVVPELAPTDDSGEACVAVADVESDGGQFAVFDGIASFLRTVAETRPQLLVLEDLHAADASSMAFLRFVHQELHQSRVLILATYRDVEVRLQPTLSAALAAIAPALRLDLVGLDQRQLARLVKRIAGHDVASGLVPALHQLTDGNPLFAEEVVRLLATEGQLGTFEARRPLPVPASARAVIRRRLEHVADVPRQAASAASVLGQRFSVPVLEAMTGMPADVLLSALTEVEGVGLVSVTDDPLTYRFRHALMREALYDELDVVRRRLHLAAAEAIDRVHKDDPRQLAAIAHHRVNALPLGDRVQATDALRAAGEAATRSFAFEDAADALERAIALSTSLAAPDEDRAELLLALGDVRRRAGHLVAALDASQEVAEIGRVRRRPDLLARAALAYASRLGGYVDTAEINVPLIAMLEEAMTALGDHDSELRCRVLSRLSYELIWVSQAERRRVDLAAQGLEIARRLGAERLIAEALLARRITGIGVLHPAECDALLDELVATASRVDDPEMSMRVLHAEIADGLSRGELERVRVAVEEYTRGAEELRSNFMRFWSGIFHITPCLLRGEFSKAEKLTSELADFGSRHGLDSVDAFYWVVYVQIWRTRMAPEDLQPCLDACRVAAETQQMLSPWRPAVALIEAVVGDVAIAGDTCDEIVSRLDEVPRDYNRTSSMCILADALSFVGRREHAAGLYEELSPYAGRHAVIGPGVSVYGPADRALGAMARLMGDHALAKEHLDRAVALDEAIGNEPSLMWTLLERARLLTEIDADAFASEIDEHRSRMLEVTARLGMGTIPGLFERHLTPVQRPPTRRGALERAGDYWRVTHDHVSFLLKDSKGLQHLARLVAEPGRELHVLDLAAARAPAVAGAERAGPAANDDLGPVLDAEAKEAYRRRWHELQDEVVEAEAANDVGRAERARHEMELLAGELSRAVGLGGRDRKVGSAGERARVNVTRALRTAIGRIGENDPVLGRHLDASIRTGTYCSYVPTPDEALTWEV